MHLVGGHIHYDSEYLTSIQAWSNLVEIWANTEKILYIISNKEGELPRKEIFEYAKPISLIFQNIIEQGAVQLDDKEDLLNFVKLAQNNMRYYGINFLNVGGDYNTIEIRIPNGTLNADTWIENINLFGRIIMKSQELAEVMRKNGKQKTPYVKEMLEQFEMIKKENIDEKEKLNALLNLCIPEEKETYMKRYDVNNALLEQTMELKILLESEIITRTFKFHEIGKYIFTGKKCVNGTDYRKIENMIEENLQIHNIDKETK